MIKIDTYERDVKKYGHTIDCDVGVDVCLDGEKGVLIAELIAVFESFEEHDPELWALALDEWLKRKGV